MDLSSLIADIIVIIGALIGLYRTLKEPTQALHPLLRAYIEEKLHDISDQLDTDTITEGEAIRMEELLTAFGDELRKHPEETALERQVSRLLRRVITLIEANDWH